MSCQATGVAISCRQAVKRWSKNNCSIGGTGSKYTNLIKIRGGCYGGRQHCCRKKSAVAALVPGQSGERRSSPKALSSCCLTPCHQSSAGKPLANSRVPVHVCGGVDRSQLKSIHLVPNQLTRCKEAHFTHVLVGKLLCSTRRNFLYPSY